MSPSTGKRLCFVPSGAVTLSRSNRQLWYKWASFKWNHYLPIEPSACGSGCPMSYGTGLECCAWRRRLVLSTYMLWIIEGHQLRHMWYIKCTQAWACWLKLSGGRDTTGTLLYHAGCSYAWLPLLTTAWEASLRTMRATVAADYTGVTGVDAKRRDGIDRKRVMTIYNTRSYGFMLPSTAQRILRKAALSGSHHLFPPWAQTTTTIYLHPVRLSDSGPVLCRWASQALQCEANVQLYWQQLADLYEFKWVVFVRVFVCVCVCVCVREREYFAKSPLTTANKPLHQIPWCSWGPLTPLSLILYVLSLASCPAHTPKFILCSLNTESLNGPLFGLSLCAERWFLTSPADRRTWEKFEEGEEVVNCDITRKMSSTFPEQEKCCNCLLLCDTPFYRWMQKMQKILYMFFLYIYQIL